MASRFCRKCGNKIPRKYVTVQGLTRKTPLSRNLCFVCSPAIKPNYVADNKSERHRRKEVLVKMLGGKCSRCGYKKSLAALSFHHIDPKTKSFDISHNGQHTWEEVLLEARKCRLLCLNCHMELNDQLSSKNRNSQHFR